MTATHLSGALGYALLFGLGAFLLVIAVSVRSFVRSTHDFVIAGRRIGLGFGVGSVIAVWTWSMAVLMSSAQAYSWGTSGLIWFIVPNGLAVVAVVPLALKLRKHMPHGYTIVEFIRARFSSRTATIVILAAQIFGLLSEIFINLFGVVLVTGVIFGLNPTAVLLVTLATITIYSYFGGLWTSAITATINTLLITIPAALVVLFVLAKVGWPGGRLPRHRRQGRRPAQSVLAGDRRCVRDLAGVGPVGVNHRRPDVLAEAVGTASRQPAPHVRLGWAVVLPDPAGPRPARTGRTQPRRHTRPTG